MSPIQARKYRPSEKRAATREQNRAAILDAAWEVFCTIGLDAANIRDIVTRSGVAQGTFYNYFRTKEAVFASVAQELLERIRDQNRVARAGATTLEELLRRSFDSYLQLLQSINGARDFIARNQHHIRVQVQSSAAMSALASDLALDLRRFLPAGTMQPQERQMAATLLISVAAESVLSRGGKSPWKAESLSRFLTRFVTQGLSGWEKTPRG